MCRFHGSLEIVNHAARACRDGKSSGEHNMKPCLKIIGLGAPDAQDDAVGFEIVKRLPDLLPADITFRKIPFPGIELLEEFRERTPIVFIDACADEKPVGSLTGFQVQTNAPLPVEAYDVSEHSLNIFEVVQLAQETGYALPPIYFISISVPENSGLHAGFSAALTKKFPAILKEIRQAIASLKEELSHA